MKIGIYGYSPASVNSGTPLIEYLLKFLGIELILFIESEYAEQEWGKFFTIAKQGNHNDLNNLDVMIYGTGSGHPKELELVKRLNSRTRTIAIHDLFWSSNFEERYLHTPDYVIVPNENQVEEFNNLYPQHMCTALGNPHFDRLKDFTELPPINKGIIGLISQCGEGGTYDEPTSIYSQYAIRELIKLKEQGYINDFVVYKHPRENYSFYNEVEIPPTNLNSFQDMLKNEVLISEGSTPHYEALLLNKETVFICDRLSQNIINKNYATLCEENYKLVDNSTEKISKFLLQLNNY